MRVAILHDHLRFAGGGERVALTLASALDADLYVTDLDPALPGKVEVPHIRTHEIARVPARPLLRQERQARAFARATIPPHDRYVLSGNWAVFAAPRFRPNVWYCHTPVRVFYDLHDSFLRSLSPLRRTMMERWIARRRPQYEAAVRGAQRIVANSRNVSARIHRFLARSSDVVYPPVDVGSYHFREVGRPWLAVNRLSHEKRIELLVETFRRLPDEQLVLAGGPQVGVVPDRFIRSLRPPPNVVFLGEIPERRLRDLYATCRGLVAAAKDEDFGLAPVEAMASGKAVVAVDEGGYRETVVKGETGWLVPATPEALAAAVAEATPSTLAKMRTACEARAREYDKARFVAQMRSIVVESLPAS